MILNKTIVVADDDADLVKAIKLRCESQGLTVKTAYNALDALKVVHETTPDLICLDVNMPCGNGLSVVEMLSGDEQQSDVPVIIMTGDSNDETIRRCHHLCAYYVEKCSDVWPRLKPLLQELLGDQTDVAEGVSPAAATTDPAASTATNESSTWPATGHAEPSPQDAGPAYTRPDTGSASADRWMDPVLDLLRANSKSLAATRQAAVDGEAILQDEQSEHPPWVLCIDDDADFSRALKMRLEQYGIAVVRAFDGMEGFRLAFTRPADVVLLDYEMPNGHGDYVLGRLKDNPVTRDIPVIVVTGRRDRMLERKMYNLGATKFLTKPVDSETLVRELRNHIDVLAKPALA